MQQLRGLSVFVLSRRLYSSFGTTVELRDFFDLVLWFSGVVVWYRISEHIVLVIFASHGLYGSRRTDAVLFPNEKDFEVIKLHPYYITIGVRFNERENVIIIYHNDHITITIDLDSHVLIVKAVGSRWSDWRWWQPPSGALDTFHLIAYHVVRLHVRRVLFDHALRIDTVHATPSPG